MAEQLVTGLVGLIEHGVAAAPDDRLPEDGAGEPHREYPFRAGGCRPQLNGAVQVVTIADTCRGRR